ncbi:MAG TPA: type VII secretion target [Mycobacterium sp.]|nr:type VII secretion target [Mycobacterium sp.]
MPARPLKFDPDELRRLSRTQQEIADQTAATRLGEDLGSAPSALAGLDTAAACVVAGEAFDALIDDVVRDMNKQAAALKLAAERYEATDADAAVNLSNPMNL